MAHIERMRYDYFVKIDINGQIETHEYLNDIYDLVKIVLPFLPKMTTSIMNKRILESENGIYEWKKEDICLQMWRTAKLLPEAIVDLLLSDDETTQKNGLQYLERNPGLRRKVTQLMKEVKK